VAFALRIVHGQVATSLEVRDLDSQLGSILEQAQQLQIDRIDTLPETRHLVVPGVCTRRPELSRQR
jgi:hypothetical protein